MTKITKTILLFILLLTFCFNFSYATNVADDTSNNLSTTITSVSQLSNYSEANLQLNNILSVILIAIGVLIILFAIAILIRLKH